MCMFITNFTGGTEELDIWTKNGQAKIRKSSTIIENNKLNSGVDNGYSSLLSTLQ